MLLALHHYAQGLMQIYPCIFLQDVLDVQI